MKLNPVLLFLLMATVLATTAPADASPRQLMEVTEWLKWDLPTVLSHLIGPEGAKIYPLWDREDDRVRLAGISLVVPAKFELGPASTGQLSFLFDPSARHLRAIVFEPEEPLTLELLERVFDSGFERGYCKFDGNDPIQDSALVPADPAEATYYFALFRSARLIAQMPNNPGRVEALRWVGSEEILSDCPGASPRPTRTR